MRYPHFLPKEGTIGFAAPSFGCAREPYKTGFMRAQEKFKKEGYNLVLGPNVYEEKGIGISNDPKLCALELEDMFSRSDVDVIFTCGGGELMCETLAEVDFDKIKKASPKWYMGYSDNTNMIFPLTIMADTACIYGPCTPVFGAFEPGTEDEWQTPIKDAFSLIKGEKLSFENYPLWERYELPAEISEGYQPYNMTEPSSITANCEEASFSGRLVGGCLDCLKTLCGTRFDKVKEFNERYKEDGIIWFLESCELSPLDITRALWQLKNAGWFENLRGFLIGRAYIYDGVAMGLDRIEAVLRVLKDFNVPIILDLDIGHLPPMMPIISGAIADVKYKEHSFSIKYRLE